MHGYGEFSWNDGKKYAGFYVYDKKEGFGIYYWSNPNRAYIGFWKGGKQDGFGKYINPKGTRFGRWKNGERERWYKNEEEALATLSYNQEKFIHVFRYDLKQIEKFISQCYK